MIEGALILAAGLAAGWFSHLGAARLRRKAAGPSPAICSCTHPWGAHSDDGCGGEAKHSYYTAQRGAVVEFRPCPCRRYSGPVPVEAFGYPQLPTL